ncbi:hypothetical protein FJY93_02185 [Candidatus Kaiserbacteria bacterium]|nr:hypothetical protein [Candidatus Kaiserbacteria bacterium]
MATFEGMVDKLVELKDTWPMIPLGSYEPLKLPPLRDDVRPIVIFSPHPDDEVLLGGAIALRLRHEGYPIINVAMTLGSKAEERPRRRAELKSACEFIGFDLIIPNNENGFETDDFVNSYSSVYLRTSNFLKKVNPSAIIVNHREDAHSSHEHVASVINMAMICSHWKGAFIESEFWSDIKNPNLLLEISRDHQVYLLKALSFHKGELLRNPYHHTWPMKLMDNVRRCEIVLGKGVSAPPFKFAGIYMVSQCDGDYEFGKMSVIPARALYADDSVSAILFS